MVQSLTRPTKGLFEGKRWPFYRGCRAGKQFKEQESFKRYGITSIERTRSVNRRSITAISGHVTDNCTTICPEKPLPAPGSKSMFALAFMVSNVQSLSPKIDEVLVMISNANLDFACITKTWLKDHINDHTVSVSGYNIIRRDRKVIDHGGVCMYIRESIRFETLSDLMDENFYGLKSAHQGSQGEYCPLLLELFTICHVLVTAIAKCPTIYSSPYPK